MQPTAPRDCKPCQIELQTFVAAEPWPLDIAFSEVHGPFLTVCIEPFGQSHNPSFLQKHGSSRGPSLQRVLLSSPSSLPYGLLRLPTQHRRALRLSSYSPAYGDGVFRRLRRISTVPSRF